MKKNPKEEPLFDLELNNVNTDYSSNSNEKESQSEQFDSSIHAKELNIEVEGKTNNYLNNALFSKTEGNNANKSSPKEKKDTLSNNSKILYDPYLESNCISRILFLWAFKILNISGKYKLKLEDLGKPALSNNASNFSKRINYIWNILGYKNYNISSLFRTIIRANISSIIILFILCSIFAYSDFFSVIITKVLIDYFNDPKRKESNFMADFPLWAIGLTFICTQTLSFILNLTIQMIQTNFAIKCGFELNCLIFDKIIQNKSSNIIYRINHGEIINYIQIDSIRLLSLVTSVPSCFFSPFIFLVYTYLLIDYFRLYFIPALVCIFIHIFINYKIGKSFKNKQIETMMKKDLCMRVITEALENIKILKLYNLENEYNRKIIDARRIEMDYFERSFHLKNLIKIINWFCPIIIPITTIGAYILFNDNFDISVILVGLSIFSKFIIPIKAFPNLINSILETLVSLKRIEDFLKLPEIKNYAIKINNCSKKDGFAIKIKNGCFSWGIKKEDKKSSNSKKILEFPFKTNNSPENSSNKINIQLDNINLEVRDINQSGNKKKENVKNECKV